MAAGTSTLYEVQEKELTRFEQAEEFQAILLSPEFYPDGLRDAGAGQSRATGPDGKHRADQIANASTKEAALRRLSDILDQYQEQSYLLDPYLEQIVVPPIRALRSYTHTSSTDGEQVSHSDAQRLARLVYLYTKVRGFKTIVHFFPHSVDDLVPTLSLLEQCVGGQERAHEQAACQGAAAETWELRYILLLWLALICVIPFDLAKFDDQTRLAFSSPSLSTVERISLVGRHFLKSPGKERDAAAYLLTKLFQRRDAGTRHLNEFLQWSLTSLVPPAKPSAFLATGILQTLCSVVKVLTPEAMDSHLPDIRTIVALYSSPQDDDTETSGFQTKSLAKSLTTNSIVNKYKAKMACRLGLKSLRRRKRARLLRANLLSDPSRQAELASTRVEESSPGLDSGTDDDPDVPEDVDESVATLLDALQDKDTVVRYSAAKGLARICCLLPSDFIDQVADEVTSLFAINVVELAGKREDLSNVSEHTWQGCCLALAEMARRGLLRGEGLGEKLLWVEKALLFDVRRGAHSVGSGVRDAACYVLWALARAHEADFIRPYADSLSQALVCVSLLDRDISIRRAASAAFQECVGRLGLFAHGIDVIRLTDFYAVSVRRKAFLDCLPQVSEFAHYRTTLVDHLIDVTLVHWDVSMRELGAESLALLVARDIRMLGPPITQRLSAICTKTRDTAVLHGSLLALAEIGAVCSSVAASEEARQCRELAYDSLAKLSKPNARTPGMQFVLRAACRLISTCATAESLHREGPDKQAWSIVIDLSLDRQEEDCHESAAAAIAQVSKLQDLSKRIETTITHWNRLNVTQAKANARVLGAYAYGSSRVDILDRSLRFLMNLVNANSPTRSVNVETRRNCFQSIASAIDGLGTRWSESVSPDLMKNVWSTMLLGLEDYTTDARGDVGSWVRMACMDGQRKLVDVYAEHPPSTDAIHSNANAMLPQPVFEQILAGLAKQMVERIESVRTTAKDCFLHILRRIDAQSVTPTSVRIPESDGCQDQVRLVDIFPPSEDDRLQHLGHLYERIAQVLRFPCLRAEVLKGIVLAIGPQRETINRELAKQLTAYLLIDQSQDTLLTFFPRLIDLTVASFRSNRYFVPCLQTINVLLEEEELASILAHAPGPEDGSDSAERLLKRVLDLAIRSIDKVKSVPRILAAMQFAMNLLGLDSLREGAIDVMSRFLLHPFPTIRSSSAELLYIQAQTYLDTISDDAEDILLSTSWSQEQIQTLEPAVRLLIESLKRSIVDT